MPIKTSSPLIEFHFLHPSSYPRERQRLRQFLVQLFKTEAKPLSSLTYIFCSDEYLLGINQQFLQHDYYTDIISFNLAPAHSPVIGEIYISVERVKENAQAAGAFYLQEMHRVIFHGALHLCGYKDKTKVAKAEMTSMEDKYLKAYFR